MYLGEKWKILSRKKQTPYKSMVDGTDGLGPMLGQHHQFHHYNSGKSNWGEERYFKIAKNIQKI